MSKSNQYCCVYGCKSSYKEGNISLHSFPRPGRRKVQINNELGVVERVDAEAAWKLRLKIYHANTVHLRVCSKHFKKDDYILPGKFIYVIKCVGCK